MLQQIKEYRQKADEMMSTNKPQFIREVAHLKFNLFHQINVSELDVTAILLDGDRSDVAAVASEHLANGGTVVNLDFDFWVRKVQVIPTIFDWTSNSRNNLSYVLQLFSSEASFITPNYPNQPDKKLESYQEFKAYCLDAIERFNPEFLDAYLGNQIKEQIFINPSDKVVIVGDFSERAAKLIKKQKTIKVTKQTKI